MVSVSATYPGASPQVLANTVATPIEDRVNSVEGIDYFDSRCSDTGAYTLFVTFRSGTDPDINLVNVQNAVKLAEPKLPNEVVAKGINVKKSPEDCLATYAFTTDGIGMSLADLGNYVEKDIADAVQRVEGVAEVSCSDREYAMRVWLDPLKMASLEISPDDVKAAINKQNIQAAAGNVGSAFASKYLAYKIDAKGRLVTPEEFESIVVRSDLETGARVLLRDIAKCEFGTRDYSTQERYGDKLAFFMSVYKTPEANAVGTADRVKAEIDKWMSRLPKGVECHLAEDTTAFTRVFLYETFYTLVIALVLVVVVTWLFLQDVRAAFVPAVAIPISLLGTFAFLHAAGSTLNVLTMFGLILVIGSLIDNAIVVVENAQSIIEGGEKDSKSAVMKSMEQISSAIVATTLVSLACYVPLALCPGMVGRMYRQFAIAMSVSLAISAFVALTLAPPLCAQLLRANEGKKFFLCRIADSAVSYGRALCLKVVRPLVNHPIVALIIFALLTALVVPLAKSIPGAFLPSEDRGMFRLGAELSESSSLERTCSVVDEIHTLLEDIPGVMSVSSTAGASAVAKPGENHARIIVRLDPWDERKDESLSLDSVIEEVQKRLDGIHRASFTIIKPNAISGLGGYGGVCVFLCAIGNDDPQKLAEDTQLYAEKIKRMKGVKGVATTFSASTPRLFLNIDRDKAEALGVTASTIFSTLQNNLAGSYINDFNMRGGAYEVIVQSQSAQRETIEDVLDIRLAGKDGASVPLSTVAKLEYTLGPRVIPRYNKMSSAGIIIIPDGTLTSLQIIDMIEKDPPPPDKYALEWSTMNVQEKRSRGQIEWLLVAAAFFSYLFLVAQYESWLLPIPVMLSTLITTMGALGGLYLAGEPLSIYAQLGLVMLIGLSAKNAILVVEFAKQAQEAGMSVKEAAMEGASRRYRAVMMTAWSFIFGVLPLVFATGAGANAQRSIGVTTLAGMLVATVIGYLFVPSLYVLFRKEKKDVKEAKGLTPKKGTKGQKG
jgi:HAE1 family hydrophobic/amphiphilic exporter-1